MPPSRQPALATVSPEQRDAPARGRRSTALRGGLWSAASQLIPAAGTAVLSVAAGRYLGSGPLGQQSLIAYANAAVAAVLVNSLNTSLLQLGGRLQGRGDAQGLRALTRWAVRAHVATGVIVLAVMVVSGVLVGTNLTAWTIIGVVSILDAAADGLAVRLILAEGWSPIGKLRLIFQFVGPPLGLVFLFAGFGIGGIFFGDGLAALGLLFAVVARYRRINQVAPLSTPRPRRRPGPTRMAGPLRIRRPRPYPAGDLDGPVPHREDAGVMNVVPPDDVTELQRTTDSGWLRPPVRVARTFGLFAVGAVITQIVSKRVEFVVLALFAGDVAVGMYSVAFMAVNLISMVPLGIAAAAMPVVAAAEGRGELGLANRHLRMALRLGTQVSIPLTAMLAALGPTAVTLVYGTSYGQASRLVPLASAGLLVAVVGGVCTQFWSGQGRLGIVLWTGGLAAAFDLGAAFALVPTLGATGAAVANLIGQLALAAGLLVATVRASGPIGWRLGGLWSATVASVSGAAAALLVRFALDQLMPNGVEVPAAVTLLVGGVVGVVVILAVSAMIKLFDAEEAEWIESLLPGRLRAVLLRLTAIENHRHRA